MASWDNYVILSSWENLSSLSSLTPRFIIGNAHRSEPSQPLTFLRMIDGVICRNNIIICKIKSRRRVKSKEAAVPFLFDNKTNVLHVATRFMAEATSSLDGIPHQEAEMPNLWPSSCRSHSLQKVDGDCQFCIGSASGLTH